MIKNKRLLMCCYKCYSLKTDNVNYKHTMLCFFVYLLIYFIDYETTLKIWYK